MSTKLANELGARALRVEYNYSFPESEIIAARVISAAVDSGELIEKERLQGIEDHVQLLLDQMGDWDIPNTVRRTAGTIQKFIKVLLGKESG